MTARVMGRGTPASPRAGAVRHAAALVTAFVAVLGIPDNGPALTHEALARLRGHGDGSPGVHRTSALCLGLRYVSAGPERTCGPGPEARQPPASGDAALDGRGTVRRPRSFRALARPECKPRRVPPKGGNKLHNKCADGIKFNAYRGANALVNGKAFDALQVVSGVLWEVKTDNFDSYPLELEDIVIRKNVYDLLIERELARACGFDFRVGVRSATHKALLEIEEPQLQGVIGRTDASFSDRRTPATRSSNSCSGATRARRSRQRCSPYACRASGL